MSSTQPQCTCSAFFETDINLREHLEEYRVSNAKISRTTLLTSSSPANSACKLNSSDAETIRGPMAMTVETGTTSIKAKATMAKVVMTKMPEILSA
jgi:hypothetical protein